MAVKMLVAAFLAAAVLASSQPFAADHEKRGVPVKTGDVAPDFTLTDQERHSHTLSAERGKRPVVLVFYRAYW